MTAGDADALMRFYNGLSAPSKRTFHPLGDRTDLDTCARIASENQAGNRYDLIVTSDGTIVGWCFLCGLKGAAPSLGLGIADGHQGQGLGKSMMTLLMERAGALDLPAVHLTVVQDNRAALRLYESFGFVAHDQRVSTIDGLHYYEMTANLRQSRRGTTPDHQP